MDRRDYLKAAGGAVVGTALATGTAAGYDRVIDVVADLGVDNNGDTPVDDDIQPYVDDDTLLEFPEGQYRIDQLITYGVTNFGMRATGTASLIPGDYPTDGSVWIGGGSVRDLTFEGFLIDTTADVGPTIAFGAHGGLVVRDIEKVGAHGTNQTAFGFTVVDPDGYALIENVRARDGDVYDSSVGATCMYTKSEGTITFRDCQIEGWADNGLYASDATGEVHVQGGYYANNNISQVRLSSPGSVVEGAHVRVNASRGAGSNMRGIRVSGGPGPVDIVDCDVVMEHGQGSGGIVVAYSGGTTNVIDSRIYAGPDYTTVGSKGDRSSFGILADTPSDVDPNAGVYVAGTAITGGGNRGSAILTRRGDTVVRGSCLDQTGDGRDGVVYQNATDGNAVTDSTVDVAGVAVVRNDASVTVSNNATDGDCAFPKGVHGIQHDDGGSDGGGTVSIPDLPIPGTADSRERPLTGTRNDTPTAIIYGQYTDPAMQSFVDGNFTRIAEEFVESGALNVQYRNIPTNSDAYYLSELGVGVWDKEPENYWGFFEHVVANQDTIQYDSVADARTLLENAGVRNYGWIPWLAEDGHYAGTVGEDQRAAGHYDLTSWSDFPPIMYLRGDLAAPQYAYDGGIRDWIEARL